MTTKESAKGQPVPVPKEPPDLIARRGKLLADLDTQHKSATGTVKVFMMKMIQVLKAMEPNAPLDEQLYQDFKDAFVRLSKDPAAIPIHPLILESIEYMQMRIAVLTPQFMSVAAEHQISVGKLPAVPAEGAAPAAAPAAPPAPGADVKRKGDGFEAGAPARKPMSLGEDAPPPPQSNQDKQQELESFKNWMKNPGLGKLKG